MYRVIFLFLVYLNCSSLTLHCQSTNPYQHYLTVCAIFNNEAPWLKEWIEYHKLLGVEHFLLYNNESNDNFREVLAPYIANNQVTLVDWPNGYNNGSVYSWVYATQCPAYEDGLRRMKGHSFWVAFIDTDEFIVPMKTDSLPNFLRYYERYGAIAINWSCFGTSNYTNIPADKLMIECLTRKTPDTHGYCWSGKSIVQPMLASSICQDPHYFELLLGLKIVDSNGRPYVHEVSKNYDMIKINHYYVRTVDYLLNHKLQKKFKMDNVYPTPEQIADMMHEGNAEEDFAILRFVSRLKKQMGMSPSS